MPILRQQLGDQTDVNSRLDTGRQAARQRHMLWQGGAL